MAFPAEYVSRQGVDTYPQGLTARAASFSSRSNALVAARAAAAFISFDFLELPAQGLTLRQAQQQPSSATPANKAPLVTRGGSERGGGLSRGGNAGCGNRCGGGGGGGGGKLVVLCFGRGQAGQLGCGDRKDRPVM